MRARVGLALLLVVLAGGGALIAFRDREGPSPSPSPPPPPSPPAIGNPAIQPVPEPERIPAEAADLEVRGAPLAPVAPDPGHPAKPPRIEIRDGAGMELRTGPEKLPAVAEEAPAPSEPAGPRPEAAPPGEDPAPPASGPESPVESGTELVRGKDVAPLPGPIDDPADLPTKEEIEQAPPPVPGEAPPAQSTLLAELNDLLRIMTFDGRVQLKLTGRLYVDGALMSAERELEDQVGPFQSGWEFRSARLGLLGVVDPIEFQITYDFAGGQTLFGEPDLKDLWIGVRDVPLLGRLRVGRILEPAGLEQSMSGNALTFMEAGLPVALVPGRNPGIMAFDSALDGRLRWWAGVFGSTPSNTEFGSIGTNVTVRVCGTPLFEEQGKRLLHLGLSGSMRPTRAEDVSLAERPEAHLAPKIVATGEYTGELQHFVGLEAAWLDGPLSLQGELQRYASDTAEFGRATFWGGYLYGSFIVTGEHRGYRNGVFLRPRVAKPAFDDGLGGAFEIAVRLSLLSLSSGEFDGGTANDLTIGLTWYMDDHSRFMINYIHTHRWGSGSADILQCRLQIDF